MTDKQIIIDVTQCPYYKEDKTCTYLPYKSKCEGDCNWTSYKEIEEQLKRKEQECEELKKEKAEILEKTGMIETLQGYTVKDIEYMEQQLDQLKSENKHLNDLLNQALKELEELQEDLENGQETVNARRI